MNTTPEMTDVFQFMELRAPFSPEAKALRQNYIRDDLVGFQNDKPARVDADFQSSDSPSLIGRLVYNQVFCAEDLGIPAENIQRLISKVLALLTSYQPFCATNDDSGDITGVYTTMNVTQRLQIFELERHPHIRVGDLYYLLPERLEQISGLVLFPELLRAFEVIEGARKRFSLPILVKQLEAIFGGRTLREVVFDGGIYSNDFRDAKRTLFDTLYLLYILRRRAPVNLEYVIEGLRVLHVIEALAVDSLIEVKQVGPLSASDRLLWTMLEQLFPELQGWNGSSPLTTLPLLQTKADFEAYVTATPVIHPIFARLHWYKQPFNDIKPIGIGDLKVVKQWLTAYLPGEISHIENVLIGEIRDRTHRRLEKTEEAFSFSSDSKTSSSNDTQSTDRFELKGEVENVVKSETNIGVNTNSSFSGTYYAGMVVITANVGTTFGYKRDTNDQTKTSNMFSRETISKAVEQVEKNVSERRSVTKLFETEETNTHRFENNKPDAKHITGIYRWLDKKYKAQLFNYGKRMMFEFVIPEPAAFFVESRIRSFESTLEIPQPPVLVLNLLELPKINGATITPDLITAAEFQKLQMKYDLGEETFPQLTKRVGFFNPATGNNFFEKQGVNSDNDHFSAETYRCKLKAMGYELKRLFVEGILRFSDGSGDQNVEYAQNTLVIYVNGTEVVRHTHFIKDHNIYTDGDNFEIKTIIPGPVRAFNYPATPPQPLLLNSDDVDLTIGLWDRNYFGLTVSAELVMSAAALLVWQTKIFKLVQSIEQQKVNKENQEIQLAYDTQMSTYRNRLDQLKVLAINDLLQGQSEAFNRDIIRTELKKHCITMLTKEFDSYPWDDELSNRPLAMWERNEQVPFRKFKVLEPEGGPTTASFVLEDPPTSVNYPAINLEEAKWRGRFIQFLEQAFEWRQLAYIFYPYFWATMPKWIEMMNRSDDGDPNMSAFLQAGSVRVLLAVTPAHDDAVLHFLATREPWDGGPAPVIGDPLFIPLHEELRRQQDDLYNAVPEGTPWTFVLPTSLVYLDGGGATLLEFPDLPTP